nr:hypothetical protein [Microctonus hyperodae filamentous virus]
MGNEFDSSEDPRVCNEHHSFDDSVPNFCCTIIAHRDNHRLFR